MGYPPDQPLPGVYWGVPLNQRSAASRRSSRTRSTLQGAAGGDVASLEELEEEIEITGVHEIAHFIGISESGWRSLATSDGGFDKPAII